jgi:SNF2 family DNA or RNA helicase
MFVGTLYPYQQEAVDRMVDRGQMLLGLVMGAGKTPTTIAAIERLISQQEIDQCLVVAPSSLKYQWQREINKFTNSSSVVIGGTAAQREKLWKTSISAKYVIVNTESLLRDLSFVSNRKWQAIVVDEATIIKSRTSKRSRLLKKLSKTIPYRYALTGQPIENRPEELFSIMEFVDPEVLGSFRQFDTTFIIRDHFGRPKRYRNLDLLNKSMVDCMVRKTREDIADQLPKIIHQVIPVEFDTKGAALYRRITQDLLNELQKVVGKHGSGFNLWQHYNDPSSNEAQGQIMSRLTVLRMLCDNPALVSRSAGLFRTTGGKGGSLYAMDLDDKNLLNISASPKLDAVLEYIKDVLAEDPLNKVVLFSFFKENLRLLQEALRGISDSVVFNGDMSAESKDEAKTKFSNDKKCRVFLSSDAGGYGVDLPMANYLISYDLPWSSGKLEQREARIIRLSSQFSHVTIATFVMKGSIEERQYDMLQHKKSVNEAFIDGKNLDLHKGLTITLGTLSNFLKESDV